MEYTKITFRIEPDNELHREILIAKLEAAGFESFAEIDEGVEVYAPSELYPDNLPNLDLLFNDKPFIINYSIEKIKDQNWNELWEKNYFKPLLINDRCLIRAPFHTDLPKAEYEIIIEPKMAFGTGYHETTYLMISEILKMNIEGKKVLDMGCGTGILGILASLKGAGSITCIDVDEWAYRNTKENAIYNHIYNIDVKPGGAELLKGHKFDVIFANIQRNILLNDMHYYKDSLTKKGKLMISGFYLEDIPLIREKAEMLGLAFIDYREKCKWVAVNFILE